MPRLEDTWYCTECAKAGKPYVYVPRGKKECPSGHTRKATGLLRSPLGRKEQ